MSKPLTESTEERAAVIAPILRSRGTRGPSLRTHLGRFFWFVIVLIALFSRELVVLIVHASTSNLHSYTLLVPFISIYLIYIRRASLPRTFGFSPIFASISLIGGIIALVLANTVPNLSPNDYMTLMSLSFIFLIIAGGFFFLGRRWMRAAAFPLAFMVFIVPMTDKMVDALETASKLASADTANMFFNLTGTPVLREGTIFQLPNITLEVAQECSGIRSSWILVITSLVAANLFLTSTWRRALLVFFVVPLGILRNGFRIWVISTLCIDYGPQMVHSILHRRGGPLFFALSLIPLFVLMWWLHRGEGKIRDQGSAVTNP